MLDDVKQRVEDDQLSGFEFAAISDLSMGQLQREVVKLRSQLSKMRLAAGTEPVSGLLNRIAFFERAQEEMMRSRRYKRDMTLVVVTVLDVDKLATRHGAAASDHYVLSLGQMITTACRAGCDVAGRISDTQFAIVLPEADLSGCQQFKDRLRSELTKNSVVWDSVTLKSAMKLSAGVLLDDDGSFANLLDRTLKQQVAPNRGEAV